MADFSYGQAIGAGFKVLGRHPLAALIWAVAYLVLVAGPSLALLAWALPQAVEAFREAAQHAVNGVAPFPAEVIALRSNLANFQPVIWLLQMAAHAILIGAVFRAVLTPQESKWAYLRLGRQELWLGLTNLVLTVMTAILILTLFIPLGIGLRLGMAAAQHGHSPGPASLPLLWLITAFGVAVIVWMLLRLCLAMPMAFATGRFALYESWRLTRGHALKMFAVWLLLVVGISIFEMVTIGVGGNLLAQGRVAVSGWQALLQGAPGGILHHVGPVMIGIIALGAVVAMVVSTVLTAPLALIYQQLTRGPEAA